MKMTMTPARALSCTPDALHTVAPQAFRGATPFGAGVEGTTLSRVRTLAGITQDVSVQDKTIDQAMGPAARGRPL